MKLLYILVAFMLLDSVLTATEEIIDPACNCDHCEESKIFAAQAEGTADHPQSILVTKEDSDGDGSLMICARDRDREDRTFPNLCHMHCFNRCTRFRVLIVRENNMKKYITSAFRTNYYKLKDGAC